MSAYVYLIHDGNFVEREPLEGPASLFLAFLALVLAIWRVGARLYTTPYGYHHARRAMYSTSCPCLLDADWCLQSDVMPDSRLQAVPFWGQGLDGLLRIRHCYP